jgi:hypothetical protein
MRYISVQPRLLYYAWQVEVMINSFIKSGVDPSKIDILVAINPLDKTSTAENVEPWDKLEAHYKDVNFYTYLDTREQPIYYISSIRPNILSQHFSKFPKLENEVIFYHDCDICFTGNIQHENLAEGDKWYVSDTVSYIGAEYIKSKGIQVYNKMCEILEVPRNIPVENQKNSGGAQYILKNVNAAFWKDVQYKSEKLFREITILNTELKKNNSEYHPLQIWCADMWAVLWTGWKNGHNVEVTPQLDFSWATDERSNWGKKPIYHNAGAVCDCGGIFFKSSYISKTPYRIEDKFDKSSNSYNYYLAIKETGEISCLT